MEDVPNKTYKHSTITVTLFVIMCMFMLQFIWENIFKNLEGYTVLISIESEPQRISGNIPKD